MGNPGPFISGAQKPIVARFRVKCVFCAAPSLYCGDGAAPAIMTQSVPSLLLLFVEVRERPPPLFSPVSSSNDTKDDFAVILCKILRNGQCDYIRQRCIIFFFFSAATLDLMSMFGNCKPIRRLLHVSTSEFSTECHWTEQSDAHQEGCEGKTSSLHLVCCMCRKNTVRGKKESFYLCCQKTSKSTQQSSAWTNVRFNTCGSCQSFSLAGPRSKCGHTVGRCITKLSNLIHSPRHEPTDIGEAVVRMFRLGREPLASTTTTTPRENYI